MVQDYGSWLPGRAEEPATLREALRLVAADVEGVHGVPVVVVVIGDCPLDEKVTAQMLAAREAMVNAAKFGAEDEAVQVYSEVEGSTVFVSVRDRGPGFDLETVPDDRTGVRESIIGRMRRHGGSARLRTAPGGGTEVELEMERAQGDVTSKGLVPARPDNLVWNAFVARRRETQQSDQQTRERERARRRQRGRRAVRRAEAYAVTGLFALAVAGYVIAGFATHDVLESLQRRQFDPSDTAQLLTAIGGLTTAVGFSIAGVVKAFALLVHARADMVRARQSLPPAEGTPAPDEGAPTAADLTAADPTE